MAWNDLKRYFHKHQGTYSLILHYVGLYYKGGEFRITGAYHVYKIGPKMPLNKLINFYEVSGNCKGITMCGGITYAGI